MDRKESLAERIAGLIFAFAYFGFLAMAAYLLFGA